MESARSTASKRGDARILAISKDVSQARDRKVPGILKQLKSILQENPSSTDEGVSLRNEIWQYNLLKVLVIVMRQDYSIIAGEWATASDLATILSLATCGLNLSREENKILEEQHLPKCVENLLILSKHIHSNIPDKSVSKEKDTSKNDIYVAFKTVLEALVHLCAGYFFLCTQVFSAQWLLQLLVSDKTKVTNFTMASIEKLLMIDPHALSKVNEEVVLTLMDELVYKLTVNTDISVAAAASRCLLKLCDHHKPLVEVLCTRYRGLRPLLKRWEGQGFERDLRHIGLLLDSGSALRAKAQRNNECARYIQAVWRGYHARKKLRNANRAFAKFQKDYRLKKLENEHVKLQTQYQTDLHHRMKMQRQKVMRNFNEKRLQTLELLPAARIEEYLRKEKSEAALRIQTLWRGHRERTKLSERQKVAVQVKSVIKIQRVFRKWLEKKETSDQDIPTHLKPPGLTDERRVELQGKISQWREENPTRVQTREDLEAIHANTQELLGRYYYNIRPYRKLQYQVENSMARLDTDSELLALAPGLKDITQTDVDMYSSRSLPVASKSKMEHNRMLKRLQLPWWKALGMEDEEVDEMEKERVEAEMMLETLGI